MTISIRKNAATVLSALAKAPRDPHGQCEMDGHTLSEKTGLEPPDLNDAVSILVDSGYVEWRQYLGTSPFRFGQIWITPMGRYEYDRAFTQAPKGSGDGAVSSNQPAVVEMASKPPVPVGSPYGFQDHDWEVLAARKDEADSIYVVLGYQFCSDHYDSERLRLNVEATVRKAVASYNQLPDALEVTLHFSPLAAGYGEHLFNEIARDVIGADIAIFETSDLNPNVMIEMGVALTWGVRVLPIKLEGRSTPPTDISGQTWADYRDSAASFVDSEHDSKLLRMVERAARKKGRR